MTKKNAKQNGSKKESRNYSKTTLKILFAFSGNQCARPDCHEPVVASATHYSDAKVIGQVAHIYAHSDGGPRSKPNLTEEERSSPANLLLLCPTHHVGVDTQHETYSADLLREWKTKHEKKYQATMSASIADIGYAELEIAAKALMGEASQVHEESLTIVSPKLKIKKNSLGNMSESLILMGAAKSQEVEDVIKKASQLDAKFPERLREGFVKKYLSLVENVYRGDELFAEMYNWAAGVQKDRIREAAGLCFLSHMFIICDVFEK